MLRKIINQTIHFFELKNFFQVVIILFLFVLYTDKVYSAEILQIKSSNLILVGDQNRNLMIGLYCLDVSEDDTLKATNILKKEFPRGTKVKIRPFGYKENILLAKVFNINGSKEMSELLISGNLAKENCLN